ncbi:hypothetical protein QUF75_12410 [Desulfococcaceae bacterium HSG7]|nr:hypothetical protein [Desulfococcaceae bacterium HSG7]
MMPKKLICFLAVCIAILSIQTLFSTKAEAKRYKFPAGKWKVDVNNYKGALYFEPGFSQATSSTHYGTILGDRIMPITFKYSTGEIRFFRPSSGQEYIGHVQGNQITGTFSSQGQIYSWRAWRDGGTPSANAYSPPPSDRPGYTFPSGKWDIDANNHKGILDLSPLGGRTYQGTIFGERITNISFNRRKGKLRFNRPQAGQQYTGFIERDALHGTFTHNNHRYNWHARPRRGSHPPASSEHPYQSGQSYQQPSQASFSLPAGSWQVEANQHRGTLRIPHDGNEQVGAESRQFGTIFNDRIINITFNGNTGELHFFRPSAEQHYSGTVRGSEINGFFTQKSSGSRRHRWRAWRR